MVTSCGAMVIDSSAGASTTTAAVPLIVPTVAGIVALPRFTPVTTPLLAVTLLTVATLVLDEAQVAAAVTDPVLPSEYVPVAVYAWVRPRGTLKVVGDTAIDISAGAVTVSVVPDDLPPMVAVMVLVPAVTPVASPAASIVATALLEEAQVAVEVTSTTVASV